MVNTEILAISAIFLGGFFVGFKVKEAIYSIKEYVVKRRN